MSDHNRPLTLDKHVHGLIGIPDARQTRGDLRTIFGSHRWWPPSVLGQLQLSSSPKDSLPNFSLTATPSYNHDSLSVRLGDVSKPDRAAGCAALRMYCDMRELPMEGLYMDHSKNGASGQAWREYVRRSMEESHLSDYGVTLWGANEATAGLVVRNRDSLPLPGLLHNIRQEYEHISPEIGRATISTAVGGLVGAKDLDLFCDAWDKSQVPGSPAESARNLLRSGVFLDAAY